MTSIFFVPKLVDDVLDFTSGANHLGKPSAADLKLGLATGPVLFACQQVRLILVAYVSDAFYRNCTHDLTGLPVSL